MRKKIIVLSISLVLYCCLISGCDRFAGERPNLNKGYSFNAGMVYNKSSVTGNLTRISDGAWEGVLTGPYAMQGVSVSYNRGAVSLALGDLYVDYDSTSQDDSIPLRFMLDAFENAVKGEYNSIGGNKTNYEIKGNTGGYDYILVVSVAGRIPLTLEIPKLDLSVNFTEAVVTELKPYDPSYFEDDIIDNSDFY